MLKTNPGSLKSCPCFRFRYVYLSPKYKADIMNTIQNKSSNTSAFRRQGDGEGPNGHGVKQPSLFPSFSLEFCL